MPRSRTSSRVRRGSHRESVRPVGAITTYGPDNTRATKLVASVIPGGGGTKRTESRTWYSEAGDVRHDPAIAGEVAAWIASRGVKETATAPRILGCPHQEGIDYPMGRTCPRCPFWATLDRFTHEPLTAPVATMTAGQVLAELQEEHSSHPYEALESADAHRDALTGPLLEVLGNAIADPKGIPDEEARLASYALYLFAKWREPRAYPLVVRWLSLPGGGAFDLAGDVVTEDGGCMLASVFDGDLQPIRRVILNPEADEYARSAGVSALAQLALWAEVPRETIVAEFKWLIEEGLAREPVFVWTSLAMYCADLEVLELFPALRSAWRDGLIDSLSMPEDELDEVEWSPRGELIDRARERYSPVYDVADATGWWAEFSSRGSRAEELARAAEEDAGEPLDDPPVAIEPYRAPPKIGRNEACPCGSGKKYKKCCGQ